MSNLTNNLTEKVRCDWCLGDSEFYIPYHDLEWGVAVRDDNQLFELLTLEGAQAGLSWITILKKRENYRKLFDGFDIDKVASYSTEKINSLLNHPGIIRNRLKVNSTVTNAQAIQQIQQDFGSFSQYVWSFSDGKPIKNRFTDLVTDLVIPSTTSLSDKLSRDLKKQGFKFVGGTICYSFMQAMGMVNDHLTSCFRYNQIAE